MFRSKAVKPNCEQHLMLKYSIVDITAVFLPHSLTLKVTYTSDNLLAMHTTAIDENVCVCNVLGECVCRLANCIIDVRTVLHFSSTLLRPKTNLVSHSG